MGTVPRGDGASEIANQGRQFHSSPGVGVLARKRRPKVFPASVIAGEPYGGGNEGAGNQRSAKAKTGLRVATGADRIARFQQCADEHPRAHLAGVESHGAGESVAQFANGGGKGGGEGGGDRQ